MKYLKKFENYSVSRKFLFFDKDGKWFSSGDGPSSIEEHKKRFGDDITFSAPGIEKIFNTLEEYNEYKKSPESSIFSGSEEAKKRVEFKRSKRLSESTEQKEDVDFIMSKIKEKFPKEKVREMFIEEIKKWIEYNELNDDELLVEYSKISNGEAEEILISDIIGNVSHETYNILLPIVEDYYDFLKYN